MHRLPEDMRKILGRPLGVLFKGDALWTRYRELLNNSNIATVGDVVTKKYIENTGRLPNIAVIDGRTKRKLLDKQKALDYGSFTVIFELKNPPGHLNLPEIRNIVEEISLYYPQEPVVVSVHGEEDLMLLPLISRFSNDPAFVALYGQPEQGVVVVKPARSRAVFAEQVIAGMKLLTPSL